jgi:methylmalonyl-CoA/ethylmalonyl-CoA epimerase
MAEQKTIGRLNHVVLAVRDLDKAEAFFSRLFDVKFRSTGEHRDVGFRTIYCENNLEIISPTRPDSDVAKFIEKKGEGVYAVGFRVPDAGKARAKAEAMGIRVVGDMTPADMDGGDVPETDVREIWLHPKDCFGMYLILPQFTEAP